MSKEIELAFDQIIKKIEPLTRFDKTSLKRESDNRRITTGKAFRQFTSWVYNDRKASEGRMPYGTKAYESETKLNEVAEETLKKAQEELPGRIQTWLNRNERNDRELSPSDCFDGPQTFGYEYRCSNCLGEGWIKCPACVNGYNDCSACNKKGRFDCRNCESFWGNAKGKVKCPSCGGNGKNNDQRCGQCGGSGKIDCPKCHGSKFIECKTCNGRTVIPCKTCGTTDRITCDPCKGKGYFYILRKIECSVNSEWSVSLKDTKQEVTQQLIKRDLVSLRELATVTQLPPTIKNTVVKREYGIECIITEIVLEIAGEKIEIIGFGPKAKIFDFQGVVPILLREDLHTLRKAVADTPISLWKKPIKLVTATKQFLESEVNINIDNNTYLTQKIIDSQYLNQVKSLLPEALKKIFAGNAGVALTVTALLPALIFLAGKFTGLMSMIGYWLLIPAIIAGITSAILFENKIRKDITEVFNDHRYQKVNRLLEKYHILWQARGVTAVAAIILLLIAINLPLP
ncbi:MAG: hypothetical protein LUM44_04040 [Pyrinomonadaceae bacterium]|nr:hypothetical protein [Pyrinomonadaceae bacterium]